MSEEIFDFDFAAPATTVQENTLFSKINEIMCWDAYPGETPEDVFIRNGNNLNALPANEIIDIVHAGGLQKWAESLRVESQDELYNTIFKAIRKCISDSALNDKKKVEIFPPLQNFFIFCQNLDRRGSVHKESTGLANVAWNGVICRRNITERTAIIFANPDPKKYIKAAKKVKDIYKFTDTEIEALRYFVCQTRHKNHNPSLNKSIYHWGDEKETGKTTVAKVIVSILNGDVLKNAGIYSSKLNRELQYNKHDVPKAALYNAVFLDEVMPKDSRKSYGAFKAMLTDDSCDFDPKFKDIITVACKRFYYFTSNDDVEEVVQDAKERRLICIHSKVKPTQISFEEVYQLWFEFCTNCTPEDDWQKWYRSFEMVNGLATKDINEMKNELLLNAQKIFGINEGTYITVKNVASKLFKNEPTREQKKTVSEAMMALFSDCRLDSNKAYYSIAMCRRVASLSDVENNAGEQTELIQTDISEVEKDLPF